MDDVTFGKDLQTNAQLLSHGEQAGQVDDDILSDVVVLEVDIQEVHHDQLELVAVDGGLEVLFEVDEVLGGGRERLLLGLALVEELLLNQGLDFDFVGVVHEGRVHIRELVYVLLLHLQSLYYVGIEFEHFLDLGEGAAADLFQNLVARVLVLDYDTSLDQSHVAPSGLVLQVGVFPQHGESERVCLSQFVFLSG